MFRYFKKIVRITEELLGGFKVLHDVGPTVTVFGSARTKQSDEYYKKAMLLSHRLANAGFNVLTGGGPGIMEAASKGAYWSPSAASIGLSIELELEKKCNDFINKHKLFDFFFARKYMMTQASFAYIVFPGGVGTLDEFFEVLTLIQTGKAKPGRIFLVGVEFYTPLVNYMRDVMLKNGMISNRDLELFRVTDSVPYVVDGVMKAHKELEDEK